MNSLIDAAFSRSRVIILCLCFLLVAGVVSYQHIPKESEPDVAIPYIYVSLHHDGIAPLDAERLLVKPMEKELQNIDGIREMRSSASESNAYVLLEFDAGFDSETALADVREKVDSARSNLPDATDKPEVHEVNMALFPVLTVSLSGPLSDNSMNKIAVDLKDQLERLPGVMEASIVGQREEVVEIEVDSVLLSTYEIDFATLDNLVNRNNRLITAGSIDSSAGQVILKVPGVIENLDELLAMPVKVEDDNVITIGDLGGVRRTFKDPKEFARIDGQPALTIEISKAPGANIIDTVISVRSAVESNRVSWPSNLRIGFHQDSSEETVMMLSDLENNVLTGVVLVVLIIMTVLGRRSSMLVALAIPGSFLTGVLIINALGYTMNVVVLFSLILVTGMLVDGAIIVVELAERNIAGGMNRRQAYAGSAKRMAWPVIASTATTLAVFFPLLFWPGMVGQFMRYLPITVMLCLLASLFMALVFIPVLGGIGTGRRALEVVPGTSLTMTGSASTGRFTGMYLRLLSAVLHRPVRVLLATVCLTIVSLVAYATFGNGVEFFPASEPDNVQVQVHARDGLSIHEKDRLIRLVERRLQGMPEISTVYARTLEPAGDSDLAEDVIGVVSFELVKWDQRRKANALIAEMRKKTSDMPGIRLEFREPDSGPDSGKPVNIRIASMSGEKLEQATDHVIGLMQSTGGFADVEDNRALPGVEWILDVDREEAARYGADLELLGNSVQMITSGLKLAEYRPDDASDELEIRIRYPLEQRNLSQLDNLLVSTATGLVPINNFVNLRPSPKTGTLQRIDGERVMTVQAGMQPGYLSNTQIELLKERLSRNPVDPDVTVNFGGEDAEMQETMQFLMLAFFVALFLMAVILVIQFNSFYQALLVMSAIVFSTCGVLFGLLVTGQALGIVMCGLGIIALAGIVVNNNIVLLDTYNSFRKSGHCTINAAMNTGALRLRPVLLTAVTTIAGLIPMVLSLNIDLVSRDFSHGAPSTQWWTQLSSTIAGGLAFSTLLTLFLTPSLLVLGDRLLSRRTGSRVSSGNSATAPFNDRSRPTVAVS